MYTAYRDCCSHYHGVAPRCATVYVPVVWMPAPQSCCDTIAVARDLNVDAANATQQALVGGCEQASLSLEYLVEAGAASPSVTLTTTSNGTSATWSDTAPAVGYHVQEALLSAKPGSKVSLTVNDAMARLRWCEKICC
jgi:hypothetical protein